MLKIIDGNILNAKEKYICHQVNSKGKMNSGVAKLIRNKWEIVFEHYEKLCKHNKNLLGGIQKIQVDKDRYVINLFGQENFGYDGKRYTSYIGLIGALTRLLETADDDIALPYMIGSVRGGGDWNFIYEVLLKLSEDFKYDIVLYRLNLG